jgi:prepilin-type N-terminal cleavage/methylation domain-containing protein/prepilin-type processing-associated H-X9-DG protein
MYPGARSPLPRPAVAGFTLLELLITVAIIGVLLSLTLPMASRTVAAARSFKCQVGQRNVAFDFTVFADHELHGDRGDDTTDLPGDAFRLETFQESEYCIDEFWCWEGEDRHELPDAVGNDPMRCPEVRGSIVLLRNSPCTGGGVGPPANVSFGFNVRLYVAEHTSPAPGTSRLTLTSALLSQPGVPLLWDVDGQAATARGQLPFFSGPSLDSRYAFVNDRYWFPAMRHSGAANFAFVDGHVDSSRTPLSNSDWRWGYVPPH